MSKNTLQSAADAFWFQRGQHLVLLSDLSDRELSAFAFEAGARWAMRETTRMSPYVNQFIEMLILLGVFDNEVSKAVDSDPSSADAQICGACGSAAPGDRIEPPH